MKNVLVYTNDLRLFYLLAKKFSDEHVHWHGIDNFADLPPVESIIITTEKDLMEYKPEFPSHIEPLIVSNLDPIDSIFLKTLQFARGIENYRELIVSVDPGTEKSGVALFLDRTYIYSQERYNFHQIYDLIALAFTTFNPKYCSLKIGNGYYQLTKKFVKYYLHQKLISSLITPYLISEHGSSKLKFAIEAFHPLSRHEYAAIAIGRREGFALSSKFIDISEEEDILEKIAT
jgi:hypothetical protein